MLKRNLIILFFISTSLVTGQQPDSAKVAVAVLGFESYGVMESETKALTDRFRTELFECGKYRIMERENMEAILEEMNFQLSGCTSSECAVKIGRMVGVSKIFIGSISKVAEYYSINIRMIDVESSQIENTAIRDISGSLGEVLTQAIPEIAREISYEPSDPNNKSIINLTTHPDSARVFLDNKYLGSSPLKFTVSPLDSHNIKIIKEGYEFWSNDYFLERNEEKNIDVYLTRKYSKSQDTESSAIDTSTSITINTHPSEAKIYLNGDYLGMSPAQKIVAPETQHHIRVSKDNYQEWDNYYTLDVNESKTIDIYLVQKEVQSHESEQNRTNTKRHNSSAFHIRYTDTYLDNELNNYMASLTNRLDSDNPFFDPIQSHLDVVRINDFKGLEFWSKSGADNFLSFNFRLGISRADFEQWFTDVCNNEPAPAYDIAVWNPAVSIDLQLTPFHSFMLHPYFNIGYGYNMLIMLPQKNGRDLEGLTFQAPGIFWGTGLEFRPLAFIGFAIDYNWRSMDMELIETNKVSSRFVDKNLNQLNLSSQNIGMSIVFYH